MSALAWTTDAELRVLIREHARAQAGYDVRLYDRWDPFAHAAKRRGCPACFAGIVSIGIEEVGVEHYEPVPCRRCNPTRKEQ
jgi:hypothetical protein